jgi:HEAT repeat protein
MEVEAEGASGIAGTGELERRRWAALAGHTGDEMLARQLLRDVSPRVRATALGALGRLGRATEVDVATALGDDDPLVRGRACTEAVRTAAVDLVPVLSDADSSVVEAAAWALGERGRPDPGVVSGLVAVAAGHEDPLCREAAVAALGAIGHEDGLPAILAALGDKPAVRRRAVLALAPFDGPDVEMALEKALDDRDRQVRQAAEDLMAAGRG